MGAKKGLLRKTILCVVAVLAFALIFTGCELSDPVTEAEYRLVDNDINYYNQDHTTNDQAVDEFVDSITALRTYLNSESFVDSGYYMGVNFDIDVLDTGNNTVGNFGLRVQAYLYTFPYEDEDGNPVYKYYENGQYYDENNAAGTRKLISGLEIHNEAIKKSDIKIEWYNGATNEVLIGLYFDGLNGNVDDPGNILYANIQGYKRSFPEFGDTVLYQQMIRLLVNLSVEGLLQSVGLQGDAGTGSIRNYMKQLIKRNYKRVVNGDVISLLFDNITTASKLVAENLTTLLGKIFNVFEQKWDPMTYKFLGFKFSTLSNTTVNSAILDMQALISPDKSGVTNVLTDAIFFADGTLSCYGVDYTYTSGIRFDYGWSYPDELMLDKDFYQEFDYGQYDFSGLLYVPSWDSQFDAVIKAKIQEFDNSTNNVFIEFRDIANGELMIGVYYRDERAYLDITGLSYMYGWVELEALGFPQVYDEHVDLAEALGRFKRMINRVIVSIVDAILDPSESEKENSILDYIMERTTSTEVRPDDIFSVNSETLMIDLYLVKHMLEETGAGTYSTRQIINILDSVMPYTMDQIAIMLGIASAEVMLEKTYFTLTWDVDKQHFTFIMYTKVGLKDIDPPNKLFQLELDPVYFGDRRVTIAYYDFSRFKPLREIWTYSGLLEGTFIFSSQETVDLSKLLSATIGESSGLNTPYKLATNAGLTFSLDYDQFVSDQYVEVSIGGETYRVFKKQKRSAFKLTVWLTGSESSIILQLMSDDVCFDNEVYKDLPAREAELGYVWVNIACVTKNGTQVIPRVKIREDVFMASMSAYMHKQTSIEDDVSSFADNDFNLSLTSIISALCKDAYVIPAAEKMEITSSNETLQNLFRVKGLIGNIKVHASFRTDDPATKNRVAVESERINYYMYQVGFFEDITGNSPYDTPLHGDLPVYFYEDYLPADYPLGEVVEENGVRKENRDVYDPLEHDFYIFPENVVLDNGSVISAGTIYVYELGAKRSLTRQSMSESYKSTSFFVKEPEENQDISLVKFLYNDLILNPEFEGTNENRLVYEIEGRYYYRTYYGVQKRVADRYVETASDGTVYVYWQGIREVVLYDKGAEYYFFDRNRAIENDNGDQAFMGKKVERKLLFEYDAESVEITEACKTQYAPRTNGSFMGEVRRYFVVFESNNTGELGKVDTLYYDTSSVYPQYYNVEDETNEIIPYDEEGTQIGDPIKMPISLVVMEPCEPLRDRVEVYVKTDATQVQFMRFNAQYVIDWELASADKRGYMTLTDVIVAPGMMGECSFPIRIIVLNREIETDEYVAVFPTEANEPVQVPVIDEIDVDPYEYAMAKYAYLSNTQNFNPAYIHTEEDMEREYAAQVDAFAASFFAQEKFAFTINFLWQMSYLFLNEVGDLYVQKTYDNLKDGVLTKYDWHYDKYEMGTNAESSVSPIGGTIYLHTYFYGQLVALKVNVGKRTFSHVKFYSEDGFDPNEYNFGNDDGDVYIVGIYRANYYAEETYDVEDAPTFVFKDDAGNTFQYVFDMAVVTGLLLNSDNSYSGVYERINSYGIIWGDPTITNITGSGSYYEEYTYSTLYSETSFTETDTRYDSLGARQKVVKVLTMDGEVEEMPLYVRLSDGRAAKRNVLPYAQLLRVYEEDEYTLLYEENASAVYKENTFDGLYSRNENTLVYKENAFITTEREYADLTTAEKAETVRVLKSNGTYDVLPYYVDNGSGKAAIRSAWSYVDLTTAQRTATVKVKIAGSSVLSEEGAFVQVEGGFAALRDPFPYDRLTEEERGEEIVVLKTDGTTATGTLYENAGGNAERRVAWAYAELSAAQKGAKIKVKTAGGLTDEYLYAETNGGYATVRNRLAYDALTAGERAEEIVVLKDDLTRERSALYVSEGGNVKVRNVKDVPSDLYEDEAAYAVYKEDAFTDVYRETGYTVIGTLYASLSDEAKAETLLVLKTDGTLETMPRYVELSNGYTAERTLWAYADLTNEMKELTACVLYRDGTRNHLPLLAETAGGRVGARDKWMYAELGNTYDFRYYKESYTTTTTLYSALSSEEKEVRVTVLKGDGTLETMYYAVYDGGYAAYREEWTYAELESEHPEAASGKMSRIVKVIFTETNGDFLSIGFGELYMADADGYAMLRKSHEGYEVEYGTGYAPKFKRNRLGQATVRDEDESAGTTSVNRPYYYFSLKEGVTAVRSTTEEGTFDLYLNGVRTSVSLTTDQYATYLNGSDKRSGGYLYLTEEQYNLYAGGDETMRSVFAFNTNNDEILTTAGLDLYHLFRIYYVRGGALYARSTLTNKEIPTAELDSQAIDATDFKVIELRVEVECPQLTVSKAGTERDDLRDGASFDYDKVDAGSNQIGYYKVDPLNASTLYLPDALTIYFNYNDGANESVHTFTEVEWCADFERDAEGKPIFSLPVYTYRTSESPVPVPLIEKVEENGVTRYKLAIDVENLDRVITFRVKVKIGNAVSGYQEVTLAVTVLSKEPTEIRFYTGKGEDKVLLKTPLTEAELVTGGEVNRAKYYSYYVDTFEDFRLPETLVATFSDGHEQEYEPVWKSAKTGSAYTFAPNTLVTMCTTIGTGDGVTLEIFLAVVVENYTLNSNSDVRKGIEIAGDLDRYYVTVKNERGQTYSSKVQISDLFQLSGEEVGYYVAGSSEYYIHISTGSSEDGDTPLGYIGLYTKDDSGEFVWRDSVTVYDFLSAVYSKATLNLTKHAMSLSQQEIISEKKSIFDHKIQLYNEYNPSIRMKLSDITTVKYRVSGGDEIISVEIKYEDEGTGATYAVDFIEENTVLLFTENEASSRTMKYSELLVYIVSESLATNYIDNKDGDGNVVGWRVVKVGDYDEETGEWTNVSTADTEGEAFTSETVLSSYVNYRQSDGVVVFSPLLGLNEGDGVNDKYIQLRDNYTNAYATLSAKELMYRLTHYFNYLRVVDGTTRTVQNKTIAINDLYKIMDVNDMLIRPRDAGDPVPQGKYTVSLGTGRGSYDVQAKILFTDGVYLSSDSKTTQTINVTVYSTAGEAQYSGGYILGNAISASVAAIINVGTGTGININYNVSATDDKLITWHVESITNAVNPVNIVDADGNPVTEGELIERIAARAVYTTGKNREITVSTLTNEGFRLMRTIIFEELTGAMDSGFSGGNPNATFSQTRTFVVDDGKITVENVYDFIDPSVEEYLGTSKYLPTTLSVTVNDRRVTVNNVEWTLDSVWYGAQDSRLKALDYRGTGGTFLMATADVLGFTDPETRERIGTTKLRVYIDVASAEIRTLPWEDPARGNGLATETLTSSVGGNTYAVYVDAFSDADANAKGAIRRDAGGTYLLLPEDLLVEYTTGKYFTFKNTAYKYGPNFSVKRIYFNENGIDVSQMISTSGDLSGVSRTLLNERFLDLTVEIGLGQNLNIRFYFHNKRIGETDYVVYYAPLTNEQGERVPYADLTAAEINEKVGSSSKQRYLKNEEDDSVLVANLMYYYTTYLAEDGSRVFFDRMTNDPWNLDDGAILDGTEDVPLYVSDEYGYVMMARIGYNDVMPVISPDDEVIRAAIKADKESEWANKVEDMTTSTNYIRIQYNLENIISQAQLMRTGIKETTDALTFTNLDSLTVNDVADALESWKDGVAFTEPYAEDELSKRTALTALECYQFASVRFTGQRNVAETYAESIVRIARGSGSRSAKDRSIGEQITEYYEVLVQTTFTQIIREYLESEFENVFMSELEGMSDADYDNSVLYKNLIAGKFDADKAVEVLYKLRSLKQNNVDPALAALQIKSYIADALEMGYGYGLTYVDYKVSGLTMLYDALTTIQQNERISYAGYYNYGGNVTMKKYEVGGEGQAQVADRVYDYDKLAQAVVVQTLYNAYKAAYDEAYKGTSEQKVSLGFDLTTEDYYKDGICLYLIAYVVNNVLENRLNLGKFCALTDEYAGAKNTLYTMEYFVNSLAYNTTITYGVKKTLRAYLINMINEGLSFTASKGVTGDGAWENFLDRRAYLVNNTFLSISNYSASINSIYRSLNNGTSITGTLRRIIELAMQSFVENVYAEKEYAGTIKGLQKLNGQIVEEKDCTVMGVFDLNAFAAKIEDNTAKYFIEPYYSYRAMPHKILVYFEDEYVLNAGMPEQQTLTDRTEDVSGRPYMTTVTWTGTGFENGVTYLGGRGTLTSTITSAVTTETNTIRMIAVAENREQKELIVTNEYMDDGLRFALGGGSSGSPTTDNRYYMITRSVQHQTTHEVTSYVYYYVYNAAFTSNSQYTAEGTLKYTLAYRREANGTQTNVFVFAAYDAKKTMVYEFENEYSEPITRSIAKQYLYVYNPFVFSQRKDMPSKVKIGEEYMTVKWNAVGIDPRGNITSTGEQRLSGKLGNSAGQDVSISISVAKWNYAGIYRLSESENNSGVTYVTEGVERRFVYMNPLYFYFSAYSAYSAQDYYLLYFTVRIYKDGATKRIVFEQPSSDAGFYAVAERNETEGGFVGEIFYPEDSRSVEYGTDDDTMEKVNERKKFLIYWDETEKKRVINNQLSAQTNCNVSIGNDEMGSFTLDSIRESGDTIAPVRATYSCERMNVDKVQMTDRSATDSAATQQLFNEIESLLYTQSGQIPVAVTPDGYLPTTGKLSLKENNVHYDPTTLRVRFLWNNSFSAVTTGLIGFIGYAYPDMEDSAKRNYARNIIMTWNEISDAERAELISLAMAYERNVVNADRSETYTNAECLRDAYALLAINERYNYAGSASDGNRLRGGGNNNVRVTVLVGVAGSTEVLETKVTVKAMFQDYTPLGYYEQAGTDVFNNIVTLVGDPDELVKTATLYIGVRKEYWDGTAGKSAYETDGRGMDTPYDNIGDDMYKLLQIAANRNAVTTDGAARTVIGDAYLVRVDNIVWSYRSYGETSGRMVSSSFSIAGVTYTSDLLQIAVSVSEE